MLACGNKLKFCKKVTFSVINFLFRNIIVEKHASPSLSHCALRSSILSPSLQNGRGATALFARGLPNKINNISMLIENKAVGFRSGTHLAIAAYDGNACQWNLKPHIQYRARRIR